MNKYLNRVFFTVIMCICVMRAASFDLLHFIIIAVTFVSCYCASVGTVTVTVNLTVHMHLWSGFIQIQWTVSDAVAILFFFLYHPAEYIWWPRKDRTKFLIGFVCRWCYPTSSTTASPRQKEWKSEPYEEEKKTLVISEK